MFLFQSRISYARKNFREDSEPNHLEESEMTPMSCRDDDSELKLLTSSCETTFVQSLPQSVQLLESQLKAKRLASAQLRLDVNDVKKASEDTHVCFLATQRGLEHLSLTQLRSHQLVLLLVVHLQGGPNAFYSAVSFLYSFVSAFICTSGEL